MANVLINKSNIPAAEMFLIGFLPSFLKKIVYRLRGYKIGKGVSIGLGTVIIGEKVEIGDHTQIGFMTLIRGREIKIGRFVEIGSTSLVDTERIELDDDVRITEMVYIGGEPTPQSLFKMGKRAFVGHHSFMNPSKELVMGDDVGIGGNNLFFTHGAWQSKLDGYGVKFGNIHLGDNCWVARGCFIMPGVSVGADSTIGAFSMVTRDVPAGSLAMGNPAKVVKSAEEYLPKMSREARVKILNEILKEWFEYLDYHRFVTKIVEENKNSWHVISKNKNKEYHIYYYFEKIEAADNMILNKNSVVISYDEIGNDTRKKIANCGAMYLDVTKGEREGSTSIGEELIVYLKRYGVKFNRMD